MVQNPKDTKQKTVYYGPFSNHVIIHHWMEIDGKNAFGIQEILDWKSLRWIT